ncbi:MYO1 [[Candida] subhashii]|uniref:MYO1 n=1 Tax=[Candida] subhashii TaxID=561895 RepID=A0A8J5QP50_9ASCO|nr:MYO1 [[Candida] subhashii]KAG7661525.1 MYO1 [[Candida] subhashii]
MTAATSEEDGFITKNWVWIPDSDDLFTKGYVSDYLPDGKCKVIIMTNGKQSGERIVDQYLLENCNPTKFNKCQDMAELTHLNESSVVYNLYLRYLDDLIYTYSGLFLVAINPYKSLPIYDTHNLKKYHEHALERPPPHIYATAEGAYRNLLSNKKDQSILVTGESGAGKTENTKKIIQYLSSVTSKETHVIDHARHIDTKIVQANPILESFGNAKTIKNNNSSRFGKFIQIYFSHQGAITGANIDYYLLEKSRVVSQASHERNYHVFYQFLRGYDNLASLGLNKDISTYKYLPGQIDIPNVDDFKQFNLLVEAFKIMGFTTQETQFIYQLLAIILHLGNVDFTSWKSDQANFTEESPIDKIVELLGVSKQEFVDNLLRPKVKAGREMVTKSKRPSEVRFAIDAFAKYLYEKMFQFIITRINDNLRIENQDSNINDNFIGVLDIAGFEIFEINSFEQLCINYTNEKLQQFFNHHSFILEQSEYMREDIHWEFIDFGQDLQPTIDLIETRLPMGIFKLLDEECIMPNSSDQAFMEKLTSNFKNKHDKFSENKFKNGFIINHYAGKVEYNVDNWLQKNTDPVNQNILKLLPSSQNQLIVEMFNNDPHLFDPSFSPTKRQSSTKVKTASEKHKDQLKDLMQQLESTEPHFVRCILPNLNKKANQFDKKLVSAQLRCNGVLEGIRITRAGYPNRMQFDEFVQRYSVLVNSSSLTKTDKTNCQLILNESKLDRGTFKIGLTKIFFKNGILGKLEEMRDLCLKGIFTDLQRVIRGNISRIHMNKKIKQIQSAQVIARTMKTLDESKASSRWMELFLHIKPLLEESLKVLDLKEIKENLVEVSDKLKDTEKLNEYLNGTNEELKTKLVQLKEEMDKSSQLVKAKESNIAELNQKESEARVRISELETKIADLENASKGINQEKEKLKSKTVELSSQHEAKLRELDELSNQHSKAQKELSKAKLELSNHENVRHNLEEKISQLQSDLEKQSSEARVEITNLERLNKKLQSELDDKSRLLPQKDALTEEIATLKQTIFNHESKIFKQENLMTSLKADLKKHDSNKQRYESKIEEAKNKISLLKGKSERKSLEIDNYKNETRKLQQELEAIKSKMENSISLKKELEAFKQNEGKLLQEIESLKSDLSASKSLHETLDAEYEKLKFDYENIKRTKDEYGARLSSLNKQVDQLRQQKDELENEKENHPPHSGFNPQFKEEYAQMKLKLNEHSAALRKEKLEHKKVTEELSILKQKLSNGTFSNFEPSPTKRRSVSGGNTALLTEIEDLRLSLQQEQTNYQRAEAYAVELQKKLNKIQATRGINTSTDYEKKFKDSQSRISHLEDTIHGMLGSDGTAGPESDHSKRSSLLMRSDSSFTVHALQGASQDFVQIYQDITKTLKTTRDELATAKSEILRLKSLLRESEEELYEAKRENYRTSVADYENNIAQMKVKLENVTSRNSDLTSTIELYKNRSNKYFKKLEAAESAVQISKRHEEAATKEMEDLRHQLILVKEEVRASQILIKEFQKKTSELEESLSQKKFELDRAQSEINELKDKLDYHIKNYENKEVTDALREEIRTLHKDLNFKTETETTLIKENKQLQLDYEDTLRAKKHLQNELDEQLIQNDELETKVDELSNKVRKLEDEGFISERKIKSFMKQVSGLKELVEEVTVQRDNLLAEKEKLQENIYNLAADLENSNSELSQTKSTLDMLRTHLENQRADSEFMKSELNQSKMSSTSEFEDQQKLRKELLVTNEENFSLRKTNEELKTKVHNLEEKLYSNEQLKYWEEKVNELSQSLDKTLNEKQDAEKTVKGLERTVKSLEIRAENESQLAKRYNDENFDYQNKINYYKSNVDILHNENVEKDLQLKMLEREKGEMKTDMMLLQKEVLELRAKLGVDV